MRLLQRLRQAIRAEKYRISSHANEEMSEDEFEAMDIERIILQGGSHGGSRVTRVASATKWLATQQTAVAPMWRAVFSLPVCC
jgi:hypothetical protein